MKDYLYSRRPAGQSFLAKYHVLELLILIIFQVCLQFPFIEYTDGSCHDVVDRLYPSTKLKVFLEL